MAKLLEDIAERFALPAEAAAGAARVTVTGRGRVLIENHRAILAYSPHELEVGCGGVRVRIRGEGLTLRAMERGELLLTGTISGVEFD